MVHFLFPCAAKTFGDYSKIIVENYVLDRIDIVWDVYIEHSIKFVTRELCGQGTQQMVWATTFIPHNWADFLKCSDNKKELLAFLTGQIV